MYFYSHLLAASCMFANNGEGIAREERSRAEFHSIWERSSELSSNVQNKENLLQTKEIQDCLAIIRNAKTNYNNTMDRVNSLQKDLEELKKENPKKSIINGWTKTLRLDFEPSKGQLVETVRKARNIQLEKLFAESDKIIQNTIGLELMIITSKK